MIDSDLTQALTRAAVRDGRLIVAVSGGRDSVVLLDGLTRVAPNLNLELVVAHVHHGLRGDEADADANFVAQIAARAGLRFALRRVDPLAEREGKASRQRPTIEEAARSLRRAALETLADEEGAGWIATAHHLGDQAETVMLRILRGTGPDGLAAMAPADRTTRFIRPLLGTMPGAIESAATQGGLEWREDASNEDRAFSRNRLRHDWLPGLAEAFNPNLLRNLANLAEAERTDLEWIEGLVAAAAKERIELGPAGIRLAIDGWNDVPEALAGRLVRFALVEAGLAREITRAHIERVLEFLTRGRSAGRDLRIELPEGKTLRRIDDAFLLSSTDSVGNLRDGIRGGGGAKLRRRD